MKLKTRKFLPWEDKQTEKLSDEEKELVLRFRYAQGCSKDIFIDLIETLLK